MSCSHVHCMWKCVLSFCQKSITAAAAAAAIQSKRCMLSELFYHIKIAWLLRNHEVIMFEIAKLCSGVLRQNELGKYVQIRWTPDTCEISFNGFWSLVKCQQKPQGSGFCMFWRLFFLLKLFNIFWNLWSLRVSDYVAGVGYCRWSAATRSRRASHGLPTTALSSHFHHALHWAQCSRASPRKHQLWSAPVILVQSP